MSYLPGIDIYEDVLQLGDRVIRSTTLLSKLEAKTDRKIVLSAVDGVVDLVLTIYASLCLSMRSSVMKKISVNGVKYPMEKVQCEIADDGRSIKKHGFGSAYSLLPTEEELSQWTKQSSREVFDEMDDGTSEDLQIRIDTFSRLRGWTYSPRGLVLSLRSEYGEVCGCLEYVDLEMELHPKVKSKLAMELADLFIYCVHTRRVVLD